MDYHCENSEIDEIIEYYKKQRDPAIQENLVSMLRELQELLGCIPEDIKEQIADALAIKPALIHRIIKLYPSLTTGPRLHRIVVCTGQACQGAGGQTLLAAVRQAILQKPFRLTVVNCLKQCRTAPNLQIDGDLYTQVAPEDLPSILSKYEAEA